MLTACIHNWFSKFCCARDETRSKLHPGKSLGKTWIRNPSQNGGFRLDARQLLREAAAQRIKDDRPSCQCPIFVQISFSGLRPCNCTTNSGGFAQVLGSLKLGGNPWGR